jgi:tetratricopeptide (TPR) repeat protein
MRRLRKFFGNLFGNIFSGFGSFKALNPSSSLRGVQQSVWNAGFLRGVMSFFLFVVGLFWSAIRWFGALDWRLFLQGAPALTVAAVVGTFSIMAMFTRAQDLEIRYTSQAAAAMNAKDYKQALACYERLSQLQNDREETLYDMAIAAEMSGDINRCLILMRQLAPPDKAGYPQAHLWNASYLMLRYINQKDARELAKVHLETALEGGVADKESAHGLLGELYLIERKFPEAEKHLLIAVAKRPNVRLRLAYLYAAQGDRVKAKEVAEKAAKFYSEMVADDRASFFARMKWAEAEVFLEDFQGAIDNLKLGMNISRDDREREQYRVAVGSVCVTWFDYLTLTGNPNPKKRMDVLEMGLSYDPKSLALLNRILYVTGAKSEPIQSPTQFLATIGYAVNEHGLRLASDIVLQQLGEIGEARAALRKMLVDGNESAPIHFAVGIAFWEEKKVEQARLHWERAYKLSPDTPVLANNLAFLLYQTDPSQYQRALDLINVALSKMPKEPVFLDTRGRILFKMGKYPEALHDLLIALPRTRNTPNEEPMHRLMAEVYEKNNNPDMAREHTKRADELKKKLDRK